MKSIFTFMLFVSSLSFAQVKDTLVIEEFPDIEAEFPGGSLELNRYFSKILEYIICSYDNEIFGKIFIDFVVAKDGKISLRDENPMDRTTIDRHLARLILNMPNWTPAEKDGEKVNTIVKIPIQICLN